MSHGVETYWLVYPKPPTPLPHINVGWVGGRVALPATYPTLTWGAGGRWHGQNLAKYFEQDCMRNGKKREKSGYFKVL